MKFNNKGFTMVELLVAMSIMGLLMIMAFPTMRAIQINNQNKKFEAYGESVLSAAKLYVNSYGEDVFDPNATNEMKLIGLDAIKRKGLIKDVNVSNSSCINGLSNVVVVKYNTDYNYCLHLTCTNKNDEETVLYESEDTKGACAAFAKAYVTYVYDTYEKTYEVIYGDDNYKLLNPHYVGMDPYFEADQVVFDKWDKGKVGQKITIDDDLTINAIVRKCEYKINYKKSSNDFAGNEYSSTCTVGEECILEKNKYSKPGFNFVSWHNSKDNKDYKEDVDVKDTIGKAYKCGGKAIDLTTKFSKNVCTIQYNANGGKLNSPHKDEISISNKSILLDDKKLEQKLFFDEKQGSTGLVNWNNTTYLNIKRDGYHIDANIEWNTKADGTGTSFSQDKVYKATELCPNVGTKNETVVLYANWKINKCTVTYSPNGGKFNNHADSTQQIVDYGSYFGDATNGMRNANGGHYNATRSGYKIQSAAAWINGTKTYDEDERYKAETICPNLKNGNQSVTLNVNWKRNDVNTYSCSAGKYLPKNTTTCKKCLENYYCPGGEWPKANKDQGINKCSTDTNGYNYSNAGSSTINHCYIKVSAGHYIGTKKSKTSTKCAKNTYKGAHNVKYNSTSSCNKCKDLSSGGYPNSNAGSDASTDCYKEVPDGKYVAKKKDSTATACASGKYKAAHTVHYNSTSKCTDCPDGYSKSKNGKNASTDCYMAVPANKYVKKKKDKKPTDCATGYKSEKHEVFYKSKSSCVKVPTCEITVSPSPNENGWNNTNVTIKLNISGKATAYGLTTIKYTNLKNATFNSNKSDKLTKNDIYTYYGYVKNDVGGDICKAVVKIDKIAPKTGEPFKDIDCSYDPGRHEYCKLFGLEFTDTKKNKKGKEVASGLSDSTEFKYCYGDVTPWCSMSWYSNHCDGNYARAIYEEDIAYNGARDGIIMGKVSTNCARIIKGKYNVCDLAGNCSGEEQWTYTWW